METHRKTLEEEGMNLGSGKCLAEMSHLDEHKVTAFHGKLDLNLAVSKDGIEGHGQENNELGDRNEVDLNLQEHHGLDHDEEKSTKIGYDVNRLLSDQREDEVMSGKGSDIFSSPVPAETFNNELGNEDPVHFSMEVPEAVDSRYQPENMGKDNCPHDGELKENSGRKSRESLQFENSESAFEEMEGGDGHVLGKLDGDYEAKMEDTYHSGKLVSTNGKLEGKNADLLSPGRTLDSSVSPVRHISVSPEKGPDVESSAGLKLSSSRHDVQDSSYSPRSFGPKHSSSPENPGEDGKMVLSQDHPAIFMRRSSTSPRRQSSTSPRRRSSTSPRRRCGQDSLRRDEYLQRSSSISPRRRHISPDHRRRDRSVSRSPARGNDSSSRYGRRYHDRSRSRSPRARDHYRRSPRRYSPRRKSPPSGYHSRRRSPRRRPWSPPPNRSNGIGKPGNNLFVAGFSFMTTERDLERKFSRFGRVRDVRIVRDKRSGDSRGFGFLSLERDEDADAAIRALDQTEWNGRVVLVEKSKSR